MISFHFFLFLLLDIDECKNGDNKCDSNAKCTNNIGSYDCECKTGYSGNGFTCTGKLLYIMFCAEYM